MITTRIRDDDNSLGAGNIATAPCYRRGTRILTPRGEVAIEDLSAADRVITAQGASRAIVWIGRRRVDIAALPEEIRSRHQTVQITAGAVGPNLPHRDLFVSASHCVLVKGWLVPAGHLVNGSTILLRRDLTEVDYFHVECEDEEILVAEGLPAESFVDCGNKAMFDNASRVHQFTWGRRRFRHAPLLQDGPTLARIRITLRGQKSAQTTFRSC
jgi:hypothetical protein